LRRDDGMTTIELITAMMISSILGAMTLFVFLSLNAASARSVDRALTASEARVILSSWSDLLQVAESPERRVDAYPAFETVTRDRITFYASLENRTGTNVFGRPTRVTLESDGGKIVEERFAPDADGWPDEPTTRRVLATGASATFTALDASGAEVGSFAGDYLSFCQSGAGTAGGTSGLCSIVACAGGASCAGVPGADALLSRIATVRVSLTVTDDNGESRAYTGGVG
jgi:hypothetical protein